MRRTILAAAVLALTAPVVEAREQGAQLPQPGITPVIKDALRNLGANLVLTRMNVVPYGSSSTRPFCVGTDNTVLLNVENRGGNIFPAPVEIVLTARNRFTNNAGTFYRTTIDGSTRYVTPPGAKIYVVYFRNVRVSSAWQGDAWDYVASMRTTGPRGTTVVGNSLGVAIGTNLKAC